MISKSETLIYKGLSIIKNWLVCCSIMPVFFSQVMAQHAPAIGNEQAFYAETKQVNQFFRRFNNEETVKGERLYDKDSLYRNPKNRKKYLNILFDLSNSFLSNDLKNLFIADIDSKLHPQYLEFHGGQWIAEATTTVMWKGQEETAIIYLNLQEERVGTKWVINKVQFAPFREQFKKDENDTTHFMHPLSHELEFLPLYRAFTEHRNIAQQYTANTFALDELTLFLYELKRGNMLFKAVNEVKFHVFQLHNWYFELSNFNRPGNNSGWLISKLMKVDDKDKAAILQFIYSQHAQ